MVAAPVSHGAHEPPALASAAAADSAAIPPPQTAASSPLGIPSRPSECVRRTAPAARSRRPSGEDRRRRPASTPAARLPTRSTPAACVTTSPNASETRSLLRETSGRVRSCAPRPRAAGHCAAGDARAADEKEACVRAVEHAQVVRLDGKLREAREGFVICARAGLPGCDSRGLHAMGRRGGREPAVGRVRRGLGGRPRRDRDDRAARRKAAGRRRAGRAVTLDPGEHTFRFEAPGAAPIETATSSARARRTGSST